jgi:hypothetical protein
MSYNLGLDAVPKDLGRSNTTLLNNIKVFIWIL